MCFDRCSPLPYHDPPLFPTHLFFSFNPKVHLVLPAYCLVCGLGLKVVSPPGSAPLKKTFFLPAAVNCRQLLSSNGSPTLGYFAKPDKVGLVHAFPSQHEFTWHEPPPCWVLETLFPWGHPRPLAFTNLPHLSCNNLWALGGGVRYRCPT